MTEKKWQLLPPISQDLISKFPEINRLVLQLLHNRGLQDQKSIDDFLLPNYDDQVLDPFLFTDMAKAVARIFLAVNRREKVMVFGDYDADGVCASVILFRTFKSLGLDVDVRIPFRETEGYGLNKKIAQQIIDQGFKLVITVDCGISNVEEIALFNQHGVDVIVTDHHEEPPQLPPALAIINPAVKTSGYPFKFLCGAGVAFKLVQAIIKNQNRDDVPLKLPEGFDKWLLDLVALATVGDIVSLLGENRVLVKYGLLVLSKTKKLGLQELINAVNNHKGKFNTEYLGWRLVPRINAAGRINHASVAFDLLSASTPEEAKRLVQLLENNNQVRQQLTEKILKAAEEQVAPQLEKNKILWAIGEGWPAGILGLVAGRLADRYHRPALVIGFDNDKYVGSGRSIEEFDITWALTQNAEFLWRFGGHSRACGFTIMGEGNLVAFQNRLTLLAEEKLVGVNLAPTLKIEAEIKLSDIGWDLVDELENFEPYGENNDKPLLAAYNLTIEQLQTVGSDGQHLKVLVSQEERSTHLHKLIGFSFGDWCARLKVGEKIDIVFEMGVNEWNGNRELQLKIVDLKLSKQ